MAGPHGQEVAGKAVAALIEGENPKLHSHYREGSKASSRHDYDCYQVWVWVHDPGIVVRVP